MTLLMWSSEYDLYSLLGYLPLSPKESKTRQVTTSNEYLQYQKLHKVMLFTIFKLNCAYALEDRLCSYIRGKAMLMRLPEDFRIVA